VGAEINQLTGAAACCSPDKRGAKGRAAETLLRPLSLALRSLAPPRPAMLHCSKSDGDVIFP